MWIERHLQNKVQKMGDNFKVVLVLGARQVGKSSLLSHIFPTLKHLTFDPYNDQFGAKSDPDQFLINFESPIILDEVQYTPELLGAIKRFVDKSSNKGQFYLTGSQNFSMLKNVAESMAGRVGIIELNGLTNFEETGNLNTHWLQAYLSNPTTFHESIAQAPLTSIYDKIWKGQLPALCEIAEELISDYHASYIQTYLERDVRTFEDIAEIEKFSRFLGLCAALTAQEINDSEFARELGISSPTIKRWRARLITSYQWMEILPYFGNTIKRLSKKAKGYFCDTGLACYLQRIPSPLALANHPQLGALFETFCVRLIATLCTTFSPSPKLYHWRSNGGAEVDLVLDYNGYLYPIEMKCKSSVSRRDASGILAFRETYPDNRIAPGIVLYTGEHTFKIHPDVFAVPWNASTASIKASKA